jgi:hypothetical protein
MDANDRRALDVCAHFGCLADEHHPLHLDSAVELSMRLHIVVPGDIAAYL